MSKTIFHRFALSVCVFFSNSWPLPLIGAQQSARPSFDSKLQGNSSLTFIIASTVRTPRAVRNFVLSSFSLQNVLFTTAVLWGNAVIWSMKVATSLYACALAMACQNFCVVLSSHSPFLTSSSANRERHWRSMVCTPQHRGRRQYASGFHFSVPFHGGNAVNIDEGFQDWTGRSIRFCILQFASLYQWRQRVRKLPFRVVSFVARSQMQRCQNRPYSKTAI